MNFQNADLLASSGHGVNDLFQSAADGTHSHDDVGSVGSAVVVEGLVVGADALVDLVHVANDHVDQVIVHDVGSLAVLEEGLGGLVGTTVEGMVGHVGVGAETCQCFPVDHLCQGVIFPGAQLLDLVRGTEAVEEVDEAHACLDCGQVSNGSQVHNFLGSGCSQHCHTGAAAGHNVLVVTEDGQSVGGQGTSCDVENAGQAFASNLVQVGDHQQQALGCGKGGGQGTGGQRAVDSASCACLGLHLNDVDAVAEDISAVLVSPFVHVLRHGGGGSDGVNCSDFSEGVCDVASSGVGVHTLKGSHVFHFAAPPFCAAIART